jgi:hypothetical protein
MTGLKLGKLPDRTPIKDSISLSSDLHERLIPRLGDRDS